MMGDGAWDLQAERREENPLRGERRSPLRRKEKPPEERGEPPPRKKENPPEEKGELPQPPSSAT